ncbi:MAG: glycosyltransferase, partial [Planctomycetales bacterium]|nr:glycosyltransferase [Planctomycetales bacterium]
NEGDRLRLCLTSLLHDPGRVVYVDSGSTDDSVLIAREQEIAVLQLDHSEPHTAARARNAGFEYLTRKHPEIHYIQFVDGDCQLAARWLEKAWRFLESHDDYAAVSGRLRERFRDQSKYNLMCDIEWDTPVGDARHFGGNFLIRVKSFQGVNGFDRAIIAAEDSELSVRLRAAGWRLYRLPEEMGWHDADMYRFSQWWRRNVRTGHAYAEGVALHGRPPERHFVRETARIWIWAGLIPLVAIAAAWPTGGWSLVLLASPWLQWVKIVRHSRTNVPRWQERATLASFLVLSKYPQLVGQLIYVWRRLTKRPAQLIEHKGRRS